MKTNRKLYITSTTGNSMKIKDLANLTRNKTTLQFSLNLKARKLKKLGLTPQNILNIIVPLKKGDENIKW